MYPIQNCVSEPAREGGLTADLFSWMYPEPCGSGLAREGGLIADLYFVDQVHIHSCSNGHLWFRPYGESLLTNARNAGPDKSNQKVSPQASGPSLRSCSVGPPRSAIPGRARLTRHPCRVTTAQNLHSASRRGGQIKIKSSRELLRYTILCRSWLASDGGLIDDANLMVPSLASQLLQSVSRRLHRLAPLPTTTPESAGLCALVLISIVAASLPIQRSGLAARSISRHASVTF
ncbi:hypothetical protein PS858_00565 [Pseudomonas fluorescens]|nr:hypothetical protein PS858_00565 [Pseudomonas fluorescens]